MLILTNENGYSVEIPNCDKYQFANVVNIYKKVNPDKKLFAKIVNGNH